MTTAAKAISSPHPGDELAFVARYFADVEAKVTAKAMRFGVGINLAVAVAALLGRFSQPVVMATTHAIFALACAVAVRFRNQPRMANAIVGGFFFAVCALYAWNWAQALSGENQTFAMSASWGYIAVTLCAVLYCPLGTKASAFQGIVGVLGGVLILYPGDGVGRWVLIHGAATAGAWYYFVARRRQVLQIAKLEFETRSIEEFRSARLAAEAKLLEKDLEMAGASQALLLPRRDAFDAGSYRLHSLFRAANRVSGDWWLFATHSHGLVVVVGDVVGHGAGPAMIGALSVGAFKSAIGGTPSSEHLDLAGAISVLNRTLRQVPEAQAVSTLSAVNLSNDGGMRWYSAGAPPALLTQGDRVETLIRRSVPLGYEEEGLGFCDRQLAPGDCLIIFSDGLTEMTLGQNRPLGLGAIRRLVEKNKAGGATAILAAMRTILDDPRNAEGLDDDVTIVLVERKVA